MKEKRKAGRWHIMAVLCMISVFASGSYAYAGCIDMSDYIGRNIEEAAAELGLYAPGWSMGITGSGDQNLYIGKSDASEGIDRVEIRGGTDRYSIYGLTTQMTLEEAQNALLEKGFSLSGGTAYCYSDGGNAWISLRDTEQNGLDVTLTKLQIKSREGATEMWSYVGRTAAEVQRDFPELSLETVDGRIKLSAEGISVFADSSAGDPSEAIISGITVSGLSGKYSLYGILPGDAPDCGWELGFSEGGSGEFIDMAGRVLYLGESCNGENPRISLNQYN